METARAIPAHRAREYETIYILRPNAGDEAAEKVATRIVETVDRLDGKLVEVDVWGRRRLAYKIKGNAKGVFIYLKYLGYPGLVEEIERNMRMLDSVLKYQTVKLVDELDPSTVEIDPEKIKFQGMDFTEEPEEVAPVDKDDESRGTEASLLDYEPEPIAAAPAVGKPAGEAKEAPAEAKEAPAEAKEAPAEEAPAEEAPAEAAPAEEAPAEEAPAEEAPAEEAPAEEAPAEAAPAEEAPAEEAPAEEESKKTEEKEE